MGELARAEVHDDVDSIVDACVVVVLLEGRNHFILDDAFGCGIGDIFLHAIARADVRLSSFTAFFWLDEDDRSIVLALLPYTPAVADFSGILLYAIALQVVDEEDENLGGGAVVIGDQLSLQSVDLT